MWWQLNSSYNFMLIFLECLNSLFCSSLSGFKIAVNPVLVCWILY
jgi:hypothetical protein